MLIHANFLPAKPIVNVYASWEHAETWQGHSYRPFVADARASAELLYIYITSYRQRENIALKARFWTLYFQFLNALGRLYNVPTKQNKRRETAQQPGQLTFLNMRLSEEQLQEIDNLKITPAQMMTSLAAVIESGIAFSLNYNPDRETANATFMDKREDSKAQGYALSAFGTDIPDAIKILLYKHLNVLAGDWTEMIAKPANTTRRG